MSSSKYSRRSDYSDSASSSEDSFNSQSDLESQRLKTSKQVSSRKPVIVHSQSKNSSSRHPSLAESIEEGINKFDEWTHKGINAGYQIGAGFEETGALIGRLTESDPARKANREKSKKSDSNRYVDLKEVGFEAGRAISLVGRGVETVVHGVEQIDAVAHQEAQYYRQNIEGVVSKRDEPARQGYFQWTRQPDLEEGKSRKPRKSRDGQNRYFELQHSTRKSKSHSTKKSKLAQDQEYFEIGHEKQSGYDTTESDVDDGDDKKIRYDHKGRPLGPDGLPLEMGYRVPTDDPNAKQSYEELVLDAKEKVRAEHLFIPLSIFYWVCIIALLIYWGVSQLMGRPDPLGRVDFGILFDEDNHDASIRGGIASTTSVVDHGSTNTASISILPDVVALPSPTAKRVETDQTTEGDLDLWAGKNGEHSEPIQDGDGGVTNW